ncbi:MAG: polysaccharide deacetylase family protein [Phycisphaerae bacterium]
MFHSGSARKSWITALVVTMVLSLLGMAQAQTSEAPGTTQIAKWKDDKKAVFLLMFDDSCPSHWQVAIPALVERKMIATFYINPGKAEYSKFKSKWEGEIWKSGMVYGDHTMTHQGVKDLDNAEVEIGKCAQIITDIGSGKKPRLISWGMPGVGPGQWNISAEQLKSLLKKYHLVDRPTFAGHGAVYHWQKTEQMLALADKGIKAGDMEYLVIHGLERITPNWGYQDFWALKQEILFGVLDGLK